MVERMSLSISSFSPEISQRARAWTLSFLTALGATILLFGIGSELMVRYLVVPHDPFEQSVMVFNQATSPNAAFGDSIVARGFHGQKEFVNLAFPADHLTLVDIKARAYFARRDPGRIIISATNALGDRPLEDDLNYTSIYQNKTRGLLRFLEPRHRPRVVAYWWTLLIKGKFSPASAVREDGTLVSTDLSKDEEWAHSNPEGRRTEALGFAVRAAPPNQLKEYEAPKVLVPLLRFLVERSAKVCLVRFPVAPEFRRAANAIPAYSLAREWYAATAHETGVQYVDLWDFSNDPSFFADPTHMTQHGAKKFGEVVVNRCFQ